MLTNIEIGDLKQAIENRTLSMLLTMQSNQIKSVRRVSDQDEICRLIAQPHFYAIEQHGRNNVLILEMEAEKHA